MTIDELRNANKQIGEILLWESEALQWFHRYGQEFGCPTGSNVFKFALEDALRYRKTTIEQFMAKFK